MQAQPRDLAKAVLLLLGLRALDLMRIRLTRLPSPRDLEYLTRRYLRLNGVYDAPSVFASALVELGYASLTDESEPVTEIDDRLSDDLRES